jgi:hypothetical protein
MFLSENINKRNIKMSNSTAVMKAWEHGSQNANFDFPQKMPILLLSKSYLR